MAGTDSQNSECERVISVIDPSLEWLGKIYFGYGTRVFEVKKDKKKCILKVSHAEHGKRQLTNERIILPLAKGIKGITHLVYDYGDTQRGDAVLKEYAEGETLRSIMGERIITFDSMIETKTQEITLAESGGLDDAHWFTPSEVESLKTYDDIRPLLKKAITLIKSK